MFRSLLMGILSPLAKVWSKELCTDAASADGHPRQRSKITQPRVVYVGTPQSQANIRSKIDSSPLKQKNGQEVGRNHGWATELPNRLFAHMR